jgi:phosphoserine phosphatase RsbU/P
MLKDERDIQFHYCKEPTCAIAVASEVKPTVILQDLVMPEIDGLTLVRFYRANAKTRDIPVVVLSSKEEPKTKADSFACGANDYMVKLPDKLEVIARVRYHSRGYIAMQERNQAYQALAKELSEAADYVKSLLPARLAGEPATDWCFVPSTHLGGDAFGYHWIDPEHFAIYLLDVCGHGVGAALLSVSAMNVLRSQSLPDTDFRNPAEVLKGLNGAFPMEQNNGMFFTIWYGVYRKGARELVYASAGHPPAVLVTGASAAEAKTLLLGTGGLVIGGMPDMEYRSQAQGLQAFSTLFVFSDGAYEITLKSSGTMWALEEWTALLGAHAKEPAPAALDTIRQQVIALQGSEQFDDDFSLLQVRF